LLRFERVLHFDFSIGTDSNLLWGVHLFFLTGLAGAKYTQFDLDKDRRDAHQFNDNETQELISNY
jgi:hypothetical protein